MKKLKYIGGLTSALMVISLFLNTVSIAASSTDDEKQTWEIDKSHSQVMFKVRHLGISNVTGSFNEFDVEISFNPEDIGSLSTTSVVNVGSIDTGNDRRDNHLRSDDFFNAEAFPELKFESIAVQNVSGSKFQIVGNLTIRETTKTVVLDAEMLGTAEMGGRTRAAFEASTTINRLEYGLKWSRLTEAGGLVVGEDVEIVLAIQVLEPENG